MDKKMIAISTDGSNSISLVKSVNEQEYKKLINLQAEKQAKREKIAREHEQQHEKVNNDIRHFMELGCVLAKTIYDNFVDRGLIENDDQFQQMWFDFYFNDKELDLKNAPKDFVKIFEKIRGMGYEEQ